MSEVSSSQAEGLSSQTFVTALVTNASILGIELAAFIFLKHRLSRIYEPRAYLPPPEYAFIFTLFHYHLSFESYILPFPGNVPLISLQVLGSGSLQSSQFPLQMWFVL